MIRVLTIAGTRPEAIKMAPVIKALEGDSRFDSRVLVTAQHREMLDQVLEFFAIVPDYDLDVMRRGQTLSKITNKVLTGVTEILEFVQPDVVLVHGDTTTTFAAALAAFYQEVNVGHVEAGMRTGDIRQPFPEEMNRILVARLARWHFAPSQECVDNLLREGISRDAIIRTTHNTGVDALIFAKEILEGFDREASPADADNALLVTAHRRESWGAPMREIFSAIAEIACQKSDLTIEVATHANPLVADDADAILGSIPNVSLLGPQNYADFVEKMSRARLILSDSGGIQEEGPTLGVPVIVLRNKTEYHELLDEGVVILGGTEKEGIVKVTMGVLANKELQSTTKEFARRRSSKNSVPDILDALARG